MQNEQHDGVLTKIKKGSKVKVVLSLKGVGWRGYIAPKIASSGSRLNESTTEAAVGSSNLPPKNGGTINAGVYNLTLRSSNKEMIVLVVGSSHPVTIPVPSGIKVVFPNVGNQTAGGDVAAKALSAVDEGILIEVSGPSVEVGDFATKLMNVRPRNVYTGHGILKLYSVGPNGVRVQVQRSRKVGKRK